MTKKELIFLLKNSKLSDDAEIILSSDAEGNSYHGVWGFTDSIYYKDGEIYDEPDQEEYDDLNEWDRDYKKFKKAKKCILLWPS